MSAYVVVSHSIDFYFWEKKNKKHEHTYTIYKIGCAPAYWAHVQKIYGFVKERFENTEKFPKPCRAKKFWTCAASQAAVNCSYGDRLEMQLEFVSFIQVSL